MDIKKENCKWKHIEKFKNLFCLTKFKFENVKVSVENQWKVVKLSWKAITQIKVFINYATSLTLLSNHFSKINEESSLTYISTMKNDFRSNIYSRKMGPCISIYVFYRFWGENFLLFFFFLFFKKRKISSNCLGYLCVTTWTRTLILNWEHLRTMKNLATMKRKIMEIVENFSMANPF